jgi:hypothetical protein
MSDQGRNALAAVSVMRALGNEIEELKSEISSLLLDNIWPNGLEFSGDESEADLDLFGESSSGWIIDGWHWTFPARRQAIHKRTKPKAAGELALAVDLGHAGWIASDVGFPVLIVTWAPVGDSWGGHFGESEFLPFADETVCLADNKLLIWTGEEGLVSTESLQEIAWMYAIPLFSVSDRRRISDFILTPFAKAMSKDWRKALDEVPAIPFAANDTNRLAPTASPITHQPS